MRNLLVPFEISAAAAVTPKDLWKSNFCDIYASKDSNDHFYGNVQRQKSAQMTNLDSKATKRSVVWLTKNLSNKLFSKNIYLTLKVYHLSSTFFKFVCFVTDSLVRLRQGWCLLLIRSLLTYSTIVLIISEMKRILEFELVASWIRTRWQAL